MYKKSTGSEGFTLVELVTVMLITGIVAGLAIPRIDLRQGKLSMEAAELAKDIRHVQVIAMNKGLSHFIHIKADGSRYEVMNNSGVITDPATGSLYVHTLQAGTTIQSPLNTNIYFDYMGRPTDVGGALITGQQFVIFVSSGKSTTVSIEALTGFVTY